VTLSTSPAICSDGVRDWGTEAVILMEVYAASVALAQAMRPSAVLFYCADSADENHSGDRGLDSLGRVIGSWLRRRRRHKLSVRRSGRFRGVVVDLLANDPFRSFIQVLIECVLDLQEFRPQDVVDKRIWSPHDDRRVALPPIAIGFQAVARHSATNRRLCQWSGNLNCISTDGSVGAAAIRAFCTLPIAAAAASRSPAVVAPANNAEILRSFFAEFLFRCHR